MGKNATTKEQVTLHPTRGEKAHAEFSASGSSRWLNCPGSLALSAKAPPQRESEYAAEGTRAHSCLEFLLKNRDGQSFVVARKEYGDEITNHCLGAMDYIVKRIVPGAEMLCETRVDATPFTCEGQFGTLDAAIVEEFGRLVVIDFKYGAGIAVDPEGPDGRGNSQLVYYALALSHQYDHNFSEVELVVIQPRAYHESGETVRSHVLTMDELLAWEPVFRGGVVASRAPKASLKAGEWCKFCPAGTICPELKAKAMIKAQVVFKDDVGIVSVPEPAMIQMPHLGTILEGCDRLETWIGKVREHALHVLERGGEVEGWKLVQKRSPRRWVDGERIHTEAKKEFGFLAVEEKLLSPAQLEKAVGKNQNWTEKFMEDWIAKRVTTESSGTTLVREADKRPAVKRIQDIFAEPTLSAVKATKKGSGKP